MRLFRRSRARACINSPARPTRSSTSTTARITSCPWRLIARRSSATLAPGLRNEPKPEGAALKLPRPLFGPALDDHFLIGVELDCVAPLPLHHTQKAVLPTAERTVGHARRYADVDAD